MKYSRFIVLLIGLSCFNCYSQYSKANHSNIKDQGSLTKEISESKEEIRKLINQVLFWGMSNGSIDLLPVINNPKDTVYIGFDMDKLNDNLNKLKQTGFFSTEFIENYNQVIRTLDEKVRNKEFDPWLVGDLPTFNFVSDISPWCQCQGYNKANLDNDNLEIIYLDSKSGELKWKWNPDSDWKDFIFRVVKEDEKWKISYMEGFDFTESTK